MGQKLNKPIAKARTITPEQIRDEKRMQALQQLAQQRTSFSINILCNLCQGSLDDLIKNSNAPGAVVKIAVKMADKLMEELYSVKEEKK